ncbi:hypothetical protein BFJ66_g6752 [Fusarium oxysporum f. sp. cepae]|uniref:Uncharacterized protein n=1 Tax=Fusarium oxysporum f. sp. cepae TaxID=396571 RepID=A0A3L6NCU2_FUSOX|nr:hypothetical protein BFJ65_g11350 [Fusarium oxysporum f. sp. cepae]RKK47413.1 hypothetical protein BFJ67_g7812 [Fusarium oxysporum f. sp. cepae]RKK50118.1 hypothetical protein BFJ66_g6752 [Fusarium oxysporum f. sp. cepae]
MDYDPDPVASIQSYYGQDVKAVVANSADKGWEVWCRKQWVHFINKNHAGYIARDEQRIFADDRRKAVDVWISHGNNNALVELKCLKPGEDNKAFSDRIFKDVNKLADGEKLGFNGVPNGARIWVLGLAVVINLEEDAFMKEMSSMLAVGSDFRGGKFKCIPEQLGPDHVMFVITWTRL